LQISAAPAMLYKASGTSTTQYSSFGGKITQGSPHWLLL